MRRNYSLRVHLIVEVVVSGSAAFLVAFHFVVVCINMMFGECQ